MTAATREHALAFLAVVVVVGLWSLMGWTEDEMARRAAFLGFYLGVLALIRDRVRA